MLKQPGKPAATLAGELSAVLHHPSASLLVLWIVVIISLPIMSHTFGTPLLSNGIILCVIVQALVVTSILWQAYGAGRSLVIVIIVIGLAWLAELTGSQTGFLFGSYDYTHTLQPQLMGVPLVIPLAWLMMLPPSWAVAALLAAKIRPQQDIWQRLAFILLSALAFTAWDLFLEPQMVAWGFWSWQPPQGGYFGIPWSNFLGWIVISGLITALAAPPRLTGSVLIWIYALTWLLETIGQLFFWGLPETALFGFLGMGVFIACLALPPPNVPI